MQGLSEYEFFAAADTLISEMGVCLHSIRGE